MLTNYLKIAFRHLWKNRLYAFINTTGLALGILCVLLAVLYLQDERKYDLFHANNPHLYRITTTTVAAGGAKPLTVAGTGQVQGPAFQAGVPEVSHYARVMGGSINGDFIAGGKAIRRSLLFTDASFFDVFSFKVLRGNPQKALSDVGAAVVTESTAMWFFNTTDVIGRPLEMDADPSAQRLARPLVIAAVVQDPPRHSSLQFDVLLPFSFLQLSFNDDNWLNAYLGTFVVLQPGANPHAVAQKFNTIHASLAGSQLAEQQKNSGFAPQVSYGLQRITDIHLNPLYPPDSSREGGVVNGSNPLYAWLFLGIAVFILLMAAINFINISIAGSLRRAREIGVRKVNGGSSVQVLLQFLMESALLCTFAFLLATAAVPLLLPVFNQLTGKTILLGEALGWQMLLKGVLLLAGIVLLTGLYPAYVLSGFRPLKALYGRQQLSGRQTLGRSLVVLQFSLAIFFIMATLLFYRQMNFVRTKDLGYKPDLVIRSNIPGNRDVQPAQALIRNELAKVPAISGVAFGAGLGGAVPTKAGSRQVDAVHMVIDNNYLPVMGIGVQRGRNFERNEAAGSVLVNEAYVKAAGLVQPLGQTVYINEHLSKSPKTIVGVVKDYHAGSLRERISPMVMISHPDHNGGIWIKYEKSGQAQALAAFEKAYAKAVPGAVFSYKYLHESNAAEYVQELRWEKVVRIAALLSVLICCLGLFGLAHLAIHQRIKEIGIRKVLGATAADVTASLSKDFMKPVLLALVITLPVAWRVMHWWLEYFAYRVNISWWIFAVAGVVTLAAALIAVCSQTIRAAMTSPVKSLQTS